MHNVLHPGPDHQPGPPLLLSDAHLQRLSKLIGRLVLAITEAGLDEGGCLAEDAGLQPLQQPSDLNQHGPEQAGNIVPGVPIGLEAVLLSFIINVMIFISPGNIAQRDSRPERQCQHCHTGGSLWPPPALRSC